MAKEPRFFSNVPGADKKVFYHKYNGPRDPKAQGVECYDPYDNKVYDVGDVWTNEGHCNRKTCQKDGTVMEERCLEDLEYPKECKEIRDMDFMALEYPWCCPRIACPGDEFYIRDENDFTHFCFDKNNIRYEGEQWTDKGRCNLKTCKRNHIVDEKKCPKYKIPRGCNITDPDLSKEFPDCCPTVTCPPGKGPPDGKYKLIEQVERPVSIYEWNDLFTTTSERIVNPEGIKLREGYEKIEKEKYKSLDQSSLDKTPLIRQLRKEKEKQLQADRNESDSELETEKKTQSKQN